MVVIDEEGRLFGVVNVVDALVVVIAVGVVVAGTVLVLGGGGSDSSARGPTNYGTFAFTAPLGSEAAGISVSDELTPARNDETYEIEAVHRSFTTNETVSVVVWVAYRGTPTVNHDRIYGGDTVYLSTDRVRVSAEVLVVGQSDASLSTGETDVVVATDPAVADAVEAGDEATLADETVATVVDVGRTDDRARVGLTLRTRAVGGGPAFGTRPVRVGNRLTVLTDDAAIDGSVVAVGTANATAG